MCVWTGPAPRLCRAVRAVTWGILLPSTRWCRFGRGILGLSLMLLEGLVPMAAGQVWTFVAARCMLHTTCLSAINLMKVFSHSPIAVFVVSAAAVRMLTHGTGAHAAFALSGIVKVRLNERNFIPNKCICK